MSKDEPSSRTISQRPGFSFGSRYRVVAKLVVFALVFAFICRRATQLWTSAPPQSIEIQPIWLIPAGFTYFLGWLPSVWLWREFLLDLKQPIGLWDATRAYFVGHVGKYVPGKALALVIRAALTKSSKVHAWTAAMTAACETLVFMATGLALGTAFLPFVFRNEISSHLPPQMTWIVGYDFIAVPIIFAFTFATTPASAWLFTRFARKNAGWETQQTDQLPAITALRVSKGVVVTSIGWCCHALSLGFVIQAVSHQGFAFTQFPMWLVACTLSTVGGFVILIAPGGLGVREGILVEAIKGQAEIGPHTALVIAGLLRAVWFTVELVTAGVMFLIPKTRHE